MGADSIAIEMITWQQLGYHSKPVGLLNVDGFYDSLLRFFDDCEQLTCLTGLEGKRDPRVDLVADSQPRLRILTTIVVPEKIRKIQKHACAQEKWR